MINKVIRQSVEADASGLISLGYNILIIYTIRLPVEGDVSDLISIGCNTQEHFEYYISVVEADALDLISLL